MLTITYEEFIKFEPCWLTNEVQMSQLNAYFEANPNMSALDMLALDDVSIDDRFWAVLREELIPANTLHEFACLCAERALSRVGNPDQRSVAAIAAKRKWMRGEITNEELEKARDAARDAARWVAMDAARWAASETARYAAASDAAMETASDAAIETSRYATASDAAWGTERAWQLDTLIKLLEEKQKNENSNI